MNAIKGDVPDYVASRTRHLLNHIIKMLTSPSVYHVGFVVFAAMNFTINIPCRVTLCR